MKIHAFVLGMSTAGLLQAAAMADTSKDFQIRLHPDLPEIAVIKVDGKPDGSYNKIVTDIIEYGVYVRAETPSRAVPGTSHLGLRIDGGDWISSTVSEVWTRYALTMPYRDLPQSSPIRLCNDRLQNLSGVARQEFLKGGGAFSYEDAYTVMGQVGWLLDIEPGTYSANNWEQLKVPAKIKCLGLNRDRRGAGPTRTTEPVPPLFWQTTFKIEPAQMVRDGKYICPSQLKLYGYVETGRKFQGKAIFMGPHYLSAITPLHLSYAGSRNVTATYPVKWKEIGGLTTTSAPKPKKQKLTFRFNISDLDGKLLKSVAKTLDVVCNKIEVNMPAGLSGNPGN